MDKNRSQITRAIKNDSDIHLKTTNYTGKKSFRKVNLNKILPCYRPHIACNLHDLCGKFSEK